MNTRTPDARAVNQRTQNPGSTNAIGPQLGLTAAERERGSIINFVRAVAEDDLKELGFFRELSVTTEKISQRPRLGFNSYSIPGDVTGRRDLTKATASAGGYLVSTGVDGFASALDSASLLGRLPMTRVPNLVGDATITRESGKATAGWLASESSTMPDVQSTFGQIALTPKTISGTVTLSRQLLKQTSAAAHAFVDRALAVTVAEAVDRAIIAGTGASGEPLGIANTSGIDTRTGSSFTWATAMAMAKVASGWAASPSIAWVAGVDAAEDFKTRERAAGSGFIADHGMIDGAPLIVSRSVGASVAVVMPWSQFWLASWGALELAVDASTYFRDGRVTIRCLWSIDFAVERAASVALATAVS